MSLCLNRGNLSSSRLPIGEFRFSGYMMRLMIKMLLVQIPDSNTGRITFFILVGCKMELLLEKT